MQQVEFFTESLARLVQNSMQEHGVDLPCYGLVNDPEAEHDRVEVRVDGVDELIPGNWTVRIDGAVVLMCGAAGMSEAEHSEVAAAVGVAVREVLSRDWKRKPLPWPDGYAAEEVKAEYETMPYVVLDMLGEMAEVEASGQNYEWSMRYRAFVQF